MLAENGRTLLDESAFDVADIEDLKTSVSGSFKIFEEAYHYIEDVKVLVKTQLSDKFLTSFNEYT